MSWRTRIPKQNLEKVVPWHQGSSGRWWSSTANDSNNAYRLYGDSDGYVFPGDLDDRGGGISVRCVASGS